MKDHIKEYKKKLEKGICEYMQNPVNERSAEAIKSMVKCWEHLNDMESAVCGSYKAMTAEDAKAWAEHMVNDDGTMGAHWDMADTTAVAEANGVKFEHISEWCWWVTMNMMYSDYCKVAEKYGVATAEFYADMAKAFLFDKDAKSPKEKLASYYYAIVKE